MASARPAIVIETAVQLIARPRGLISTWTTATTPMMAAVSARTTIGARPKPGAGPTSFEPGDNQASTAPATSSPAGTHQASLLTHGPRSRSSLGPGLALQASRHADAATLIVATTTTAAATAPATDPTAHPNTAQPRSRASVPNEAPAWRSAMSPLRVGRYQKDSSAGVASSPGSWPTMSLRAYCSNSLRLLRPNIARSARTPRGASSPITMRRPGDETSNSFSKTANHHRSCRQAAEPPH